MTAGYVLLGLAVVLFVAEAHLATYGLLGLAGVACLAGGAALLDVSTAVIVVGAVILGVLIVLAGRRAASARHLPVQTGREELVGMRAEVRETLDPAGQVFVAGALWRARLGAGAEPQRPGDRVRVESVEGLTLQVSPLAGAENVANGGGD